MMAMPQTLQDRCAVPEIVPGGLKTRDMNSRKLPSKFWSVENLPTPKIQEDIFEEAQRVIDFTID